MKRVSAGNKSAIRRLVAALRRESAFFLSSRTICADLQLAGNRRSFDYPEVLCTGPRAVVRAVERAAASRLDVNTPSMPRGVEKLRSERNIAAIQRHDQFKCAFSARHRRYHAYIV